MVTKPEWAFPYLLYAFRTIPYHLSRIKLRSYVPGLYAPGLLGMIEAEAHSAVSTYAASLYAPSILGIFSQAPVRPL